MKSVRFKVWEAPGGQFYAHLQAGNSRITWQSEGYARVASAHKVCRSTWEHIAGAIDPGQILQHPIVPYTKDSLLPPERRAH